jgi:hypothetical protein
MRYTIWDIKIFEFSSFAELDEDEDEESAAIEGTTASGDRRRLFSKELRLLVGSFYMIFALSWNALKNIHRHESKLWQKVKRYVQI